MCFCLNSACRSSTKVSYAGVTYFMQHVIKQILIGKFENTSSWWRVFLESMLILQSNNVEKSCMAFIKI